MSVPVTFTEGVSSTISVFALFHNAFLSAAPVPGKSLSDVTGISKRNLKDFADKYTRAMTKAKQLHDPNAFKDTATSSGFTTPGTSLLAFSEIWNKLLQASAKSELPTARDQKLMKEELAKLETYKVVNRSKLLTRIIDLQPKPYYKCFKKFLEDDSLNGILKYRQKKDINRRQWQTATPGETEHLEATLTDEAVADKLLEAAKQVSSAKLRILDPEVATWADLAKLDPEVLLQDETSSPLINDEFAQHLQTATALLTTIEQLYTSTALPTGLIKFLTESAAPFAEKASEDLSTKFSASLDEKDHADALKKYAVGLRSLAAELQNFSTTFAAKGTAQSSFELQFQSLKSVTDAAAKLSSIGRAIVPPGWSKKPLVPFSASSSAATAAAAASAAGFRNGSGSGGRSGGGEAGGSTGGALWRVLDKDRVKECTELVKKFVSSVDDTDRKTVERQVANTTEALSMLEKSVSTLFLANSDDNAIALDGLRNQQARAVQSLLMRVRGVMTRHRDRHVMFALRYNRGAMKYMLYWRDSGDASSKGVTNDYFEKLLEAITKGGVEVDAMVAQVETLLRGPKTYTGLTDTDIEAIIEKFEELRSFKQSCKDRISAVHTRPSTFMDQLMSDTHVHVIYLLKGLRFALSMMAMSIATKAFTSVYASNVYVKNVDPPSPTLFLAMFFAVELAMNAGVYTVLWASNRVFKSPSNDFPIDSYLLTAWAVDFACSELALMGIAFAFANIIATKKAFRYRQEGDRGIRALGQMMLYSYAVLLCIPFFRIA